MAIVIGKQNGSSSEGKGYLEIGWNPVTFTGAEISTGKATEQNPNPKDYLKLTYVNKDGKDVYLFQSSPRKAGKAGKGYIGLKTLEHTVNGFVQMYIQASRPTLDGLTKEAEEAVLADYQLKCDTFEKFLGSSFIDFNSNEYQELDEEGMIEYLDTFFQYCACKSFCESVTGQEFQAWNKETSSWVTLQAIDNIKSYEGTSGNIFVHYAFNGGNWFKNPVSFDKSLIYTYDEEGNIKRDKKGYPETKSFSAFSTEDDLMLQQLASAMVVDKYGIVLTRGEAAQAPEPEAAPAVKKETMDNW